MKRSVKPALFVLIVSFTLLLTSCLSTITYENSHKYSIGNVEITDPVESIDVEWLVGKITVEYGGDAVSVSETANKDLNDNIKLRYWLDGSTLRVRFAKTGRLNASGLEKDLTITLPSSTVLEKADIYGAAVDITLNGIMAKYCEVETVSGDIHLSDTIVSVSSDISTVGGNIDIKNQGVIKDMTVENVSGNIELTASVQDEIEAETVSGNLNVNMLMPAEKCELSTVSGNIALKMPEGTAFSVKCETVSGNISCEHEAVTENDTFKIAGGGKLYKIETVSGNIKIEK